jgi:GT2 family glycosyltransferase
LAVESKGDKTSWTQRDNLIRVAVIITCFNRREVTLRCLDALSRQNLPNCDVQTFVVDDASTDGTYQAISTRFPEVRLASGTGNLFWNRGMRLAFGLALAEDFDYYFWLNDDTVLFSSAIHEMLETAARMRRDGIEPIIVGNTIDPVTRQHSYGGIVRRPGFRHGAFSLAHPNPDFAETCDTMNGNCTLIPRLVAQKIGNLDESFCHNFGDLDYGLRAKAQGFSIFMAPGFVGECSENPIAGTWRDTGASLPVRWSQLNSPKGCPWPEWPLFAKRHLGPLWYLYAVSPFVRVILQSILNGRLR